MTQGDSKKNSYDFTLLITVLILVTIGIIMIFSSSQYYSFYNFNKDSYHFLKKHLAWVVIGLAALVVMMNVNYKRYKKLAFPGYIVSVILLIVVLTPLGMKINNAQRWIRLAGITIMPGEIAKIAAIVFVAASLSNRTSKLKYFFKGVLPYLLVIAIYMGLILLQPNLSTAMTIALIVMAMLFVAGMRWLHLFGLAGLGVGMVGVLIAIAPYRKARLTTFLDPFKDPRGNGYQVIQSLYALGSGGLSGVGLGRSVQNKLYLPEPQNDFIFATIGEELGFIGCFTVMILFLFLIWRCIKVCIGTKDQFGCYLATGITAMIAIQVMINIAVATSSMPVTGIPLPFISYGGNSVVLLLGSVGIMLNISKQANRQ